jgi:hypothetical protein
MRNGSLSLLTKARTHDVLASPAMISGANANKCRSRAIWRGFACARHHRPIGHPEKRGRCRPQNISVLRNWCLPLLMSVAGAVPRA